MNKKLFLGMFAAAGMLFATSCSNDELDVVQSGNEAQVTFSLAAEGGIATRAISDGKSADILYYAIYDANKQLITTINGSTNGLLTKDEAFPNESKQDVVEVTLAKGQEYTAVFWAQDKDCKAYTVEAQEKVFNVGVTYDGLNNDETRDAFFAAETFKVTGNAEINVIMKRPFAQINVGVTAEDWEAAVASGIEIAESKVVIKNAANSINLLDGTVSGEEEVTYGFSTIPAKFTTPEFLKVDVNRDDEIQEDEKYVYLSMSYILTDNDAERTTLEADGLQFTFKSGGADIVFDEGLHAVPVQRNWRTNILGKILTGDIQFNIEIDQEFDDNYNLMYPDNGDDVSVVSVTTAEELTNAIKNAKSDITINFAGDITGNATAKQKENVNVVVNGNGYTYDGAILVDGSNRSNGAETMMFTNINFKADASDKHTFIYNVKNGNPYPHNITIKDCNFVSESFNENVGGINFIQAYHIKVENCTAENLHSLAQFQSIDNDVTVSGVTITNCKNGISFGNTANPTISNSTINTTAYGIRGDGDKSRGNLIVENITINAEKPIIIRKVNSESYNVSLSGENVLNTSKVYHIVFTNGDDDAEYVTPTGKYTINGAEGFNVYPMEEGVVMNASSSEQLSNVIAEGATTVNLSSGSYTLPSVNNSELTIQGTKDVVVTINKPNYSNTNLTLAGITVKGSGYATGVQHVNTVKYNDVTIVGDMCLYGEEVVFTDCTFELNNQYIWTYGAKKAKFENCEFNTTGKAILVYNEGAGACDVTVSGCKFNASAGAKASAIANQNCAAIEIDNYQSSGVGAAHKVSTTNNTYSSNFSGEWRIKNYVSGNSVTVNEVVYSSIAIDGKTMSIDTDKNVTVNK